MANEGEGLVADSIPVYCEPPREGLGETNVTIALPLEPGQSALVFTQVRLKNFQASAVVILHDGALESPSRTISAVQTHLNPLLVFLGQHVRIDHLGLDGHAR